MRGSYYAAEEGQGQERSQVDGFWNLTAPGAGVASQSERRVSPGSTSVRIRP